MRTTIPIVRCTAAWLVHTLTASTAVIGILTLKAIYYQQYLLVFWLMLAAIFIDAIDGTFARWVKVTTVPPHIDGALLDNIVDYLNYVITPCFFLLVNTNMIHSSWRIVIISAIALASAYQFTQADAKTADHFFKGFPSYWNIVVFYLFLFNTSSLTNSIILSSLVVLVFVPIKYVYPARMDHLTRITWLRYMMLAASILYGIVSLLILLRYPIKDNLLLAYSLAYIIVYLGASLYRTLVPLPLVTIEEH